MTINCCVKPFGWIYLSISKIQNVMSDNVQDVYSTKEISVTQIHKNAFSAISYADIVSQIKKKPNESIKVIHVHS